MMEIKQEVSFDSGTPDGCISVRKQKYIEVDGRRISVDQPERCAFSPGQFEELMEYAPDLYDVFKAIWTPDVIKAWKEKTFITESIELGG